MAASAAACIILSSCQDFQNPSIQTEIPDLTGMTLEEARMELKGRSIRSDKEFSDTVSQGCVIRTEPSAGSSFPEDNIIKVIISSGTDKIEVPDFIGDPMAEAKVRLTKLGLSVSKNEIFSTDIPRGSVVSQAPPAGTLLDAGDMVVINISMGPAVSDNSLPEDKITVPKVTGLNKEQAKAVLSTAGLRAGEITGEGDLVSSQDPKAGSVADKGTKINLIFDENEDSISEDIVREVEEVIQTPPKKREEYKVNIEAPESYEEGTSARILLKGKQSGIVYSQTKVTSFPVTILIPVKDIEKKDKEGVFMVIYTDHYTGRQLTDMSRKINFASDTELKNGN